LSAQAFLNLSASTSISAKGFESGFDMMPAPILIAKSKVSGSRAAIQSGGCGFCTGFGTEVADGHCQCLPLCV
jgi:hypothetical protein